MSSILLDIFIVLTFAAGYFLGAYAGKRRYLRGVSSRYVVLMSIILAGGLTLLFVHLLQLGFPYIAWIPGLFAGLLRQSVKASQS